jgi:hypothetical protein
MLLRLLRRDKEWRPAVSARLALILVMLVPSGVFAQWGYSYHSSTLEEGIQRGFADVVRSQGMANLYNAQAASQFQQARSQYIDNQYKATQTYFEMRRYNTEARRAERSAPLSTEQYVRLARVEAPQTLTNTQLDPLTGAIAWPVPLAGPEYAMFRAPIEKLFADRYSGYSSFSQIQQAVQAFADQLKADIMKFQANDYVAAKKFLDSLIYAARGTQS